MQGHRLLYGLGRIPASAPPGDPRLPSVRLGAAPLRLNTEPLPPAAMPADASTHPARLDAVRAWLAAASGDYAPRTRRFLDAYLAFVAACIEQHRDVLESRLRRFDGLYAVEDWTWSALRPLPRAWQPGPSGATPVDLAFWDGARLLTVDMAAQPRMEALFPDPLHTFWAGETLPASPFRRTLPV